MSFIFFFFFFQAEDGIRDRTVTGVQTCALPILTGEGHHGGGAAVRRRYGTGEEVVGEGDGVSHRLVEVAVRVDAAGEHVTAGGVDVPAGRAEAAPQGGDD